MQATLDSYALKPFTKALNCLSRYGDDLTIVATPEHFSLSTMSSASTAYCRFKYERSFFSKYKVASASTDSDLFADEVEEVLQVRGQLLTKSLLSILRHRTFEKTVERCELSMVDGETGCQEDCDSLESKLIVRLHCKYGVVKTHRLLLQTDTQKLVPEAPNESYGSHLRIGARAIKDIVEHFQTARGVKSDPQLVWSFDIDEVQLSSRETIESKIRSQISTELKISASEFDAYDIHPQPITIAFHLREFNAAIAFAESMSLPLDIRFADPTTPLFISVEAENSDTLFVICTSQVGASSLPSHAATAAMASKKRERGEDHYPSSSVNNSHPATSQVHANTVRWEEPGARAHTPSQGPQHSSHSQPTSRILPQSSMPPPILRSSMPGVREPLFLPSSQATVAEGALGQGFDETNTQNVEMEHEVIVEQVDLGGEDILMAESETLGDLQSGSFELTDLECGESYNDSEFLPTQGASGGTKAFRPIFED